MPQTSFLYKSYFIFLIVFSHFWGLLFGLQALCTDVCTYQYVQNEYTTMYYHSDQSPHAMHSMHQYELFHCQG